MTRLFVFTTAALAVALSACGGPSPEQMCNDVAATTCNRMYTCYTGKELETIKMAYGPTEADCTTRLKALAACATRKDTATACENGKTYDAAAASQCLSDWKALSCDALKTGMTPSSCNNICK